jgi:hypothetical protein
MTNNNLTRGGAPRPAPENLHDNERYVAWFHELDAWTEYWDIYHPETLGRFYFGDGNTETGLLTLFLPRTQYPPAWTAWTRMALATDSPEPFITEILKPEVASAVMEVDALVARLFAKHFGDASDPRVQADYLEGIFRFAIDALPPATERDARIPEGDWRKPTAGRHTLDGDLMWFAWALQLEAAHAIAKLDDGHAIAKPDDDHSRAKLDDVHTIAKVDSHATAKVDDDQAIARVDDTHAIANLDDGHTTAGSNDSDDLLILKDEAHHARRALLLAGVATGCPANFAWRGHRRTRAEYQPNVETISLLRNRGLQWAADFESAAAEVHALYRIREWGEDG